MEVCFLKIKIRRRNFNLGASIALVIALLSNIPAFHLIHREMLLAATILIVGDVIFGLIFLRCPHCKKLLNLKWESQSICHSCGERLDEE